MTTKINGRRLISGGLLAGLLFNIGGISIAILMDVESAFRQIGWEPNPATGFLHMGMRFVLGIVGVFLYVAMRPRFGSGPKTAVIAGVCLWFIGYLLPTILLTELGVFTTAQSAVGATWGLFEACLAVTTGAWVYRE